LRNGQFPRFSASIYFSSNSAVLFGFGRERLPQDKGATLKSLMNSRDRAEILKRLANLRSDSRRHWGKMSSQQMVCHLSDSFNAALGEKEVRLSGTIIHRTFVKWVALRAPFPWPRGVRTMPEVDQEIGGTRPTQFDQDMKALEIVIERFTQKPSVISWHPHPLFGKLSDGDWMRWGYLHMVHHLRQFGI
jgi:hypothetical protein